MVIALHLGAHKTATTYMQDAMELSREELRKSDIGYVPLTELRPRVTRRLDFGRPGLQGAVNRLLDEYRGCKRLIISDENIIGGLKPSAKWGFYPKHRKRLAKLVGKLGRQDFQIYFATRSYDEFISAMYCEYIRHQAFVGTEAYLRNFAYGAFSWGKIVETFVTLIGADNVHLWRYEDFPAAQDQIFASLIDAPADLVQKPTGRVRESLSVRAVQTLASLEPARNPDEARARARAAAAAHPKGSDNPPFTAFSSAISQTLRARYESEISLLPHTFPGIRLLGQSSEPER
jgi:hypothetical protein